MKALRTILGLLVVTMLVAGCNARRQHAATVRIDPGTNTTVIIAFTASPSFIRQVCADTGLAITDIKGASAAPFRGTSLLDVSIEATDDVKAMTAAHGAVNVLRQRYNSAEKKTHVDVIERPRLVK